MKKILMVEDDKFTGEMYQRFFKLNGYDVELVPNGEKALDILKKTEFVPSLITLDVHLPGMDGYELLKTIKKDDRLKSIPVAVLTNSFYEENSKDFLDLGADLFIVKIHTKNDEVLGRIKKLLEERSK